MANQFEHLENVRIHEWLREVAIASLTGGEATLIRMTHSTDLMLPHGHLWSAFLLHRVTDVATEPQRGACPGSRRILENAIDRAHELGALRQRFVGHLAFRLRGAIKSKTPLASAPGIASMEELLVRAVRRHPELAGDRAKAIPCLHLARLAFTKPMPALAKVLVLEAGFVNAMAYGPTKTKRPEIAALKAEIKMGLAIRNASARRARPGGL